MKLIVHMVGNAHLDPAWLWTWPAGVDESLNTCRTACDMLDLYPEVHITRGEAWVYDQVRKADPATFRRIQAYVSAGRWHIVNGWWIQPDCNLPGEVSFQKQTEIGELFFKEHFGVAVDVGYNVDSFGHCAMLPTFLTRAGMNAYVFMRPQPSEKQLPSELFRWQSPVGDMVPTFRILSAYFTGAIADLIRNLQAAVAAADRAVGHTMCFYGVGDHGGGPTRAQIEWIRQHQQFAPDVELRFSHPRAFFDAVKSKVDRLPLVAGELQMHAVGCYSVVHDIKQGVRQGEAALMQAEIFTQGLPESELPETRGKLLGAWRRLLFNEFHDILGGSCIHNACRQSIEELGFVKTVARDLLVDISRRIMTSLPPCPRQRLVIWNPSTRPWHGMVEFEPYLPVHGQSPDSILPPEFILLDETGAVVPSQDIPADAGTTTDLIGRAVFPVQVPANGRQVLEVYRRPKTRSEYSGLYVKATCMGNGQLQLKVGLAGIEQMSFQSKPVLGANGIQVAVMEDLSDTWSHGVVGYEGPLIGTFTSAQPWRVRETGPLRVALENTLSFEGSLLHWIVLLEKDSPVIRMKLRMYWHGYQKIVKLLLPAAFQVQSRRDGTPGAVIGRPLDGHEYPLRDLVALQGEGLSLAMVSPDISGVDVQHDGLIRATLLRCPAYANQIPFVFPLESGRPITDQGTHEYDIAILPCESDPIPQALDVAHRMNFPLWIAETTKGMTAGWAYDPALIVAADKNDPPIMPFEAMAAWEIKDQLVGAPPVTLVPSEKVCPGWPGERLILSENAELGVDFMMPCDSRYCLTAGYVGGGEFGGLDVYADGQLLGRLRADAVSPRGMSQAILTSEALPAGKVRLDLRRTSGRKTALSFLECTPILRDIGGASWMGVGPFNYDVKSGIPPEQLMETAVYAPEKSRTFSAVVDLGKNATASWIRMSTCADYVDFKKVFGAGESAIHYAVTYFFVPRPYRVRLRYKVDCYLRMWLNGNLVLPFACGHGATRMGHFSREVDLPAGRSELLVKVASGSGCHGLWMAVSDLADMSIGASPDFGGVPI